MEAKKDDFHNVAKNQARIGEVGKGSEIKTASYIIYMCGGKLAQWYFFQTGNLRFLGRFPATSQSL